MKRKGTRERGEATLPLVVDSLPVIIRSKLLLEVAEGADQGAHVEVEADIVQVGTQEGAALQLHDDSVSRIHLQIRNAAEGIVVRDLESTNGTWLEGGVRITEAVVPSGTVLRLGRSRVRVELLKERVSEGLSKSLRFGEMIGKSQPMRAIFSRLERLAPTDETVLISGETGTGKEVCALSIVESSARASGPLEVVDCGAIPPTLLESTLFGHVRGAFTDARSDYAGAFQRAHGGTVFLDEIGELPLELQTRLLRAVENRQIIPVGGRRPIPLDLRIIAATNRELEQEVNRGTFRADLYYRLSVVQIRLPPLRERPEDIPLLAGHFLQEMGGRPDLLDAEQLQRMQAHRWPGNVRELRNYLRRLTLGEREQLELGRGPTGDAPAAADELAVDLSLSFKEAKEAAVARFERAYLTALLAETAGNISQAARVARTDRTYLSRLLNRYGIERT